jgi:hypothetical protein
VKLLETDTALALLVLVQEGLQAGHSRSLLNLHSRPGLPPEKGASSLEVDPDGDVQKDEERDCGYEAGHCDATLIFFIRQRHDGGFEAGVFIIAVHEGVISAAKGRVVGDGIVGTYIDAGVASELKVVDDVYLALAVEKLHKEVAGTAEKDETDVELQVDPPHQKSHAAYAYHLLSI